MGLDQHVPVGLIASRGSSCTPGFERVPTAMRTLSSSTLGQHAIGIEHYGALYRLKITAGQLILNKQADQQGK